RSQSKDATRSNQLGSGSLDAPPSRSSEPPSPVTYGPPARATGGWFTVARTTSCRLAGAYRGLPADATALACLPPAGSRTGAGVVVGVRRVRRWAGVGLEAAVAVEVPLVARDVAVGIVRGRRVERHRVTGDGHARRCRHRRHGRRVDVAARGGDARAPALKLA